MSKEPAPLKWVSAAIAAFVLAVAIYTRNPALFVLAGLSAAAALALSARR